MKTRLKAAGITTVFVDIDGTLTQGRRDAAPDRVRHPLVELLVDRGVAESVARERVRSAEAECARDMVGREWPFGADRVLGIAPGVLACHIVERFRRCYEMAPDARRFMLELRGESGLCVYPATTNPCLYIRGKLAAGGLADASGTDVFDACFGGEEVAVGGKCGPAFYRALMTRVGARPDRCVMVGDEVAPDRDAALAAGIGAVYIVNRGQDRACIEDRPGVLFVRSLETVLAHLREQPDDGKRVL